MDLSILLPAEKYKRVDAGTTPKDSTVVPKGQSSNPLDNIDCKYRWYVGEKNCSSFT